MAARREVHIKAIARPLQRGGRLVLGSLLSPLVVYSLALAGCGGTTGLAPSAQSSTGSVTTVDAADLEASIDDGGFDMTMVDDRDPSALFDVTIQYTDRLLPDVHAQAEGALAEAGAVDGASAWLACAPDFPAIQGADGSVPVLDATFVPMPARTIPAVFTADGGQAPAAPGTECATHVWFGNAACDSCVRRTALDTVGVVGEFGVAALPPCSDLVGAGAPSVGPGAGVPRIQLCRDLFDCMLQNQCWTTSNRVGGCFCQGTDTSHCNSTGGDGVCFEKLQRAMEFANLGSPGATYLQMSLAWDASQSAPLPSDPGHGAYTVNPLFEAATSR